MTIPKSKKRVNTYQPQYEPPNLSEAEQERVKNLTDSRLCNAEVERVAHNIANAIANPDTPQIVRDHIKAYLNRYFYYDWAEVPEAILCLFPYVCHELSQIPFVPLKAHIEALTGNDKKQAIEATKEKHDFKPHKSITRERVAELTDALLGPDIDDDELRAAILIALVDGIGHETSPARRERLINEAFHRAYAHAVRYSEQEEAFIAKAITVNLANRGASR